jgi:hypothetical protein
LFSPPLEADQIEALVRSGTPGGEIVASLFNWFEPAGASPRRAFVRLPFLLPTPAWPEPYDILLRWRHGLRWERRLARLRRAVGVLVLVGLLLLSGTLALGMIKAQKLPLEELVDRSPDWRVVGPRGGP